MFVFVLLNAAVSGQNPLTGNTTIVNGYGAEVYGTGFRYHSSIPDADSSMIIRTTDGNDYMEWLTDPVPANITTENITFAWLAGIGSSPGRGEFSLWVNGQPAFTIVADGTDEWTQQGANGSSLYFTKDMIDQYGDRFGFIYLTMPAGRLKAGEKLRIRATGAGLNKTTWLMTFRFKIHNGITIKALPALKEKDGQPYQLGVASILHLGKGSPARFYVDGKLIHEADLHFGYNYIKLDLPAVNKAQKIHYRVVTAADTWKGVLQMKPVKKWRVNFVQHSHTDIGYTRSQTDILAEHLRYIDYALDYCDNTDDYPEKARFRWTCEASWAVEEYLRSRPASQVARLKQRVAEGRIELTGMYFNFDELPDEQTLAASLRPVSLIKAQGMEVKTAMQNDVNGIGWSLCDYYHDLGVKYLNMGTHGHRALICFDKPTLFWWESPSGNRMLAYRAEHYMTGNTVFKIHAGDFNVFEDKLLTYLTELEAKGYAYDLISIQHSGFLVDNSPPSTLASDMIRQWNEKYAWPVLQTATATSFFEEMEQKHGDEFQVIRGAWPDWWTDGFGASAREVAATRQAQGDLIANAAGLSMALLQGAALPEKVTDRIDATNSALLFYTEHTVGYHNSVYEPYHKYSLEQRRIKESYAWEAARRARMLGEETMGLLQEFVKREKEPSLIVYNTLNWKRSGLLRVYIDHQTLPRYTPFVITDQQGREAWAQAVEHHSDGTYYAVWVDDIPAFGYKKYLIKVDKSATATTLPESREPISTLENKWYRLELNMDKGTISSITDKELNLQLVDTKATYSFGEFIYELLNNRSQIESHRLNSFTRQGLDSVWFDGYEAGEVWNTLKFRGNTAAAQRDQTYVFEIRLFNTTKRIDLFYAIEKKLVTDPEGIYIALPFALSGGQLALDVPGGEIRAGIDQIPGSSNDWNTIQTYARLYNQEAQLVVSSVEAPLMQFGNINTGRFKAGAVPETTHMFGWPMNNYWVTNFNADQHGGHEWLYSLTSQQGNSMQAAARFGREHRTPMPARVLPGGGNGDVEWEKSLLNGLPDHVMLISATPAADGKSILLHLRETEGKSGNITLQYASQREVLPCIRTDVNGHPAGKDNNEIKALESAFFRVQVQ